MNLLRYIRQQFFAAMRAGDVLAALDWLDALDEEVQRVAEMILLGRVLR